MKRYMMMMTMMFLAWTGMNAMDYETARERAYYLTDKMAYELNLNDRQYNDAYEINLDYFLSINTAADLADPRYLNYRNSDLRHILYDWQWTAFAAVDYLFHPLRWLNGRWHFPIFTHYAHDYYFYRRPAVFLDYRGGHGRLHFAHGYYASRRPIWNGGLRGANNHMVGHPNPGGGRFSGQSGHFRLEMNRRPQHPEANRPGVGGNGHNPNNGNRPNHGNIGNEKPGSNNGFRPDNNRPGSNSRPDNSTNARPNKNNDFRSSSRTTVSNPGARTGMSSRGSSVSRSTNAGAANSRSASPSARGGSSTRGGNGRR